MAQSQPARSIFEYLTEKNVELKCTRSGPGRNSSNIDWLIPKSILPWKDFNFSTLETIYHGRLKDVLVQPISPKAFPEISEDDCEISEEDSLTALILKWNHTVVSGALLMSFDKLGKEPPSHRLAWVRGCQASPIRTTAGYLHPDWAGIQKSIANSSVPNDESVLDRNRKPKANNILPGDTKVSRKWTIEHVREICLNGNIVYTRGIRNWLHPIMQVFTYCVKAKSRYGYIITDKELVALRVGPRATNAKMTPTEATERDGLVEYKSIRWGNHRGETPTEKYKELTINLALWWLHLLAGYGHSIEWDYNRLTGQSQPVSAQRQNQTSDAESGMEDDLEPSSLTGGFISTMELGDLQLAVQSNKQTLSSRRSSLKIPFEHLPGIEEEEPAVQLETQSPLRRRSTRIATAAAEHVEKQQQVNVQPADQHGSTSLITPPRKRKRVEADQDKSRKFKAR